VRAAQGNRERKKESAIDGSFGTFSKTASRLLPSPPAGCVRTPPAARRFFEVICFPSVRICEPFVFSRTMSTEQNRAIMLLKQICSLLEALAGSLHFLRLKNTE
jgi:hypothetical protein